MAQIELAGVTKTYTRGQKPLTALKGIDLAIEAGEFVVMHGASGSGKTTLLSLLGGLDLPTAGSVRVNDRDLARMSDADRSTFRGRQVGFIFQSFHLQSRQSLLRNVMLPLIFNGDHHADRKRMATEALEAVGLDGRHNERVRNLSGGQQQRVAIARAIVNVPAILLADEPTGNLDSESGDRVIDLLDRINRDAGTTVIVATHDENVRKRARRTLRVHDGALVEDVGNHHATND